MRTSPESQQRFHDLHRGPGVLVIPNPWDALSARLLSGLGFPAMATTSAGVAWSYDRADGQKISKTELLESIQRIAAAAGVPVSADIESGFGESPAEVAATVREVIEAGAVGINLEDGAPDGDEPLLSAGEHSSRIRAVRTMAAGLGFNLFINARTDVYLLRVGERAGRFDNAVERARAYLDAGADGVFVPGVSDPETISQLVTAIPAPLNILLLPDTPPVSELQRLGVRRLSTGARLAQAALGLLRQAAVELREDGTYHKVFEYALPFPELQEIFGRPPGQ